MEKTQLKRHDMVFLTKAGKNCLLEELLPRYHGIKRDMVEEILAGPADIPGFVRRDEQQLDKIAIGFVHHAKLEDNRLRVAAYVSEEWIRQVLRPYDAIRKPVSPRSYCIEAALFLQRYAAQCGLQVGVLGSAALEMVTGITYTDRKSDLDLLVRPAPLEKLEALYKSASEHYPSVPFDFEVELPNGFGVKLTELFMNTGTVLGKSLTQVDLLNKKDVLSFLN